MSTRLWFPCTFYVKLSVILMLDPFRFFLLEKIFFLTLYLLRFTIIGLGLFWPAFFFPILCVRSRSGGEISVFISVVSITKLFLSLNRPSLHYQFQQSHEPRDSFDESTAHTYLILYRDSQLSYSILTHFLPSSCLFFIFLFLISHTHQILCM